MALKIMYTIFLGLLVALFVGLGIAAFYPAPKMPEYPVELQSAPTFNGTEPEATRKTRAEYDKQQKDFEKAAAAYNRTVSIISIITAVIILVLSFVVAKNVALIADGLLLGGVLTLLYGIVRGFMGEDSMYRFLATAIGLVIALIVGWQKFHPEKEKH